MAGGHESKELAALEGKSEALSYFPGDVGDDGLGASFKKDLVFDECCHQVPGATLTAKCITVLLPRSVFNKDSKRSLQVDDLPVQDVMPHDQHRGSLWQNKKETPEVQGKVIKFRCLPEMLLGDDAGTSTPSTTAEKPQQTTHPHILFTLSGPR